MEQLIEMEKKSFINKNITAFSNIIGYDDIKKELLNIIKWYEEKDNFDVEISLPNILFFGSAGCGKSLFIKELKEALDVPSYEIKVCDDDDNISEVFEEARKQPFALVLIDELDLLIENSAMRIRALQSELDGIDKSNNILVLATTNSMRSIPSPLLRNGRFDRIIHVGKPNKKEILQMFEYYFDYYKIDYSQLDLTSLVEASLDLKCVDIKAVCNDIYLRMHNEPINNYLIEQSIERIDGNSIPLEYERKYFKEEIAIHEIGHRIVSYFAKKNRFTKATFSKKEIGGFTRTYKVEEEYYGDASIEEMEIGLGGYCAEKLFGYNTYGAARDLLIVRHQATILINKCGYYSPLDIMQEFDNEKRLESEKKRRSLERKTKKLIKQEYKKTTKLLSGYKKEILILKDIMLEKGYIDRKDMETVLGNIQ